MRMHQPLEFGNSADLALPGLSSIPKGWQSLSPGLSAERYPGSAGPFWLARLQALGDAPIPQRHPDASTLSELPKRGVQTQGRVRRAPTHP